MLIQFPIVLVLILVLKNSFQLHRRNFARLCQAEWMLTARKDPNLNSACQAALPVQSSIHEIGQPEYERG
jgi:hypothetical protein